MLVGFHVVTLILVVAVLWLGGETLDLARPAPLAHGAAMNIICGGGVIGTRAAYYLAKRGADVTVIERAGVANGPPASPVAFSRWTGAGARRSTRWRGAASRYMRSWRKVWASTGATGGSDTRSREPAARPLTPWPAGGLGWLGLDATVHGQPGTRETTAQVTPELFTKGMMEASDARLMEAAVDGIVLNDGRATGVLVDGTAMAADAVVIAMVPGRSSPASGCRCQGSMVSRGTASFSTIRRTTRRRSSSNWRIMTATFQRRR